MDALFAEATTEILSGWPGIIGQLGVVAILVWYLYYNTTVVMPRIHQAHSDLIKEIVDKFDASLDAERKSRETQLFELRQAINNLTVSSALAHTASKL